MTVAGDPLPGTEPALSGRPGVGAVSCPVPGLGPLESAIMAVAWDVRRPLTVHDACNRLDYRAGHGDQPAYTTVMFGGHQLARLGFAEGTPAGPAHRRG
jgi:hypothetical protein